ncbi:amino acid adenylation domain-containing protein [Paenibacillus sp. NRS-1781]|uniref:amino acid adenylation domain-containing protein n=1 Tax=Paenibacillus sp. NRS-1781 TaxID=3233905 RepID=UPI003D2C2576
MIDKKNIKDMYELSPLQKGILYHYLQDSKSSAYFEQMVLSITGTVDIPVLEKSINALIQKYDILRTTFIHSSFNTPIQLVLKERSTTLIFKDLSHMDESEQQFYMERFKLEDREIGFDLQSDVLIRFALFQLNELEYQLIWSHHHILMDGWCIELVLKDLLRFYHESLSGNTIYVDHAFPYSSYIKWLQQQDSEQPLAYWENYLQDYDEYVSLPGDKPTISTEYQAGTSIFELSEQATILLSETAKQNQVTLSTAFQTLWGILLQKYNNTDDVVFGTVVSGRSADVEHIESIVGLFINTVPVRISSQPGQSIADMMRNVQQHAVHSEKYSYVSLSELAEHSGHRSNMIDHVIVFENYPLDMKSLNMEAGLPFEITNMEAFEQTNYNLDVTVYPGERMKVVITYNIYLYSEPFINRISTHFQNMIFQLAQDPGMNASQLDIISDAERKRILEQFNNTRQNFVKHKTIQELFEEQVVHYPHTEAVVYENTSVSYYELNIKVNQVAERLRELGVRRNEFVAVMTDRSIEMIIAILGVIKAGAAYLPIDHSYPEERIEHMLRDSGAAYLICDRNTSVYSHFGGHTLWIDDPLMFKRNGENIENVNQAEDLVYMIYTSGSTGKPKGVMVDHQALHNYSLVADIYHIKHGERVLQTASLSFDASVGEIFLTLLNGATLIVVNKDFMLSGEPFMHYLRDQKVSSIQFVPSMLKILPYMELPDLKLISTGGEQVESSVVEKWGKGRVFLNAYGPTETTVDATHAVFEGPTENIHIGKPIYNKLAYIVNKDGKLQPVGIAGELCIGGEGLAKGYWGQEELTAEKFTPNPFRPGGKMYRTGDLARFLEDGNIQYLGRMDKQAKIRGYRIELGEIEAVLREQSSIKEAVVIIYGKEMGQEELCAYIVTNQRDIQQDELRAALKRKLPEYMIPSRFTVIQSIPLTLSGKVDRKQLPDPATMDAYSEEITINSTEEALLQIWKEVLGKTNVSVTDHFFSIGGHSLKALMLLSRIQKSLKIKISLQTIMTHPTIRELAKYLMKEKITAAYPSIIQVPKAEYYAVSSAQKRLYSVQQLDGIGTSYHIPFIFELRGKLDVARLKEVIESLVDRHETLRTSFHLIGSELKQKVHEKMDFRVEYIELATEEATLWMQQFMKPFKLDEAPLIRVKLIKLNTQRHFLLMDINHIVFDGLSADILLDEMMKLYRGESLPELHIQYKDYAVWQQQLAEHDEMKKQEKYWLDQMQGDLPTLDIPTDYPRPSVQQFEGNIYDIQVTPHITEKLNGFAKQQNVSVYTVLLSAYNVLLAKYTGTEDIVVGTNTAGRSHFDVEPVVGMFASTLAIRSFPEPSITFKQFLMNVKQTVFAAMENQDYPLEKLLERLNIRRDISRNPLFDTMFVFENPDTQISQDADIHFSALPMKWNHSKLDLTWYIREMNSTDIQIFVEYSTQLFEKYTIERMSTHFMHLLDQLLDHPDDMLGDIEVITKAEKHKILTEFNDTAVVYPSFRPVHRIFEEQAEKKPNSTALIYDGQYMSYADLNERANQLARHLQQNGVTRNSIVGIMTERSFEMMIGIMGILKSGAAYMPISQDFPSQRIKYMVENSGTSLLLTTQSLEDHLESIDVKRVNLDNPEIYRGDISNLLSVNEEHDLAYIIYTSGSTGQPKGVMIEHGTLLNRITWMVKEYNIQEHDVFLQKTPYVFDVSVWELLMWFFTGAHLCILKPEEEKSPQSMIDVIQQYGVTSIHFVPSMFNSFLDFVEIPSYAQQILSLKRIFTSGEALLPNHVSRFQRLGLSTGLYNLYGPTEATVDVSFYNCSPQDEIRTVLIGKPIDNVMLYIINQKNQLQPIGVPGELCISGTCLARGYINRDDLTAQKFVENPFLSNQKMYKTGDLARWLPDGNIEYLGRIDNQVKIRGYRIELDEITGKLLDYSLVKEGAVVTKYDHMNMPYLSAYYVSEIPLDKADIKMFLAEQLPDYMIPSHFVQLEKLPLNHNGKLNAKALPEPNISVASTYLAPESEQEMLLASIWSDVLQVERIGVTDNFFELGGDSIKAITFVANLSKHNLQVEVSTFLKHPSIQEITPYLQEKTIRISQQPVVGEASLTPIQHWFFEQKLSDISHWNQSALLYRPEGWNSDEISMAMDHIVQHHDSLRIIFAANSEGYYQMNRTMAPGIYELDTFEIHDDTEVETVIQQQAEILHRALHIEKGPLVRLGQFKTGHGDYLIFVVHHLLIDGVSWRILFEDFSTAYEQAVSGIAIVLPEKTTSYLEWSRQLIHYAQSHTLLQEIPYWTRIQQSPVVLIPDKQSSSLDSETIGEITIKLDKKVSEQLITTVHRAYRTEMNDILLAALALTIRRWSGHSDVVVSLEGHGREEIMDHLDISRTIGWFTSMYPVLFQLPKNDVSDAIKTVKETLRKVPKKGIGYGILKYLTPDSLKNGFIPVPKPQILFNYLGQIDTHATQEFTMSNFATGKAYSEPVDGARDIEINGMFFEGQMKFILSYQTDVFSHSTMEAFSQEFLHNLKDIVRHCSEQEIVEYTPSDFTVEDLSMEELGDIFDALK